MWRQTKMRRQGKLWHQKGSVKMWRQASDTNEAAGGNVASTNVAPKCGVKQLMSSGTAVAKQCYGKCVKGIQWQAQKCMPVPCWSGINLTECKVISLCKVEKVDLGNPQKLEKLEKLSDQMGVKASMWVWTLFRSVADPLFYFQSFWQLNCWRCKCGGAYAMAADFVVFKMCSHNCTNCFKIFINFLKWAEKLYHFFSTFFNFLKCGWTCSNFFHFFTFLELDEFFCFFNFLKWGHFFLEVFSGPRRNNDQILNKSTLACKENEKCGCLEIFRNRGGTMIKFWKKQLVFSKELGLLSRIFSPQSSNLSWPFDFFLLNSPLTPVPRNLPSPPFFSLELSPKTS